MTYNVFYMNPGATQEILDIVSSFVPPGWRLIQQESPTEFEQALAIADFIVVANDPITKNHLALAPNLKMIQHQGVGYEKIDLLACKARNIPVGLTPEGTTIGVAEHTLLLILAVYKQIVTAMNGLTRGQWMQWSLRKDSYELAGKTLGLVGYGRIGREVARRAIAFDAHVIAYDPFVSSEGQEMVRRMRTLDELLSESDVVSLHVPENSETHHLMNATNLARMREGAILINAARGGLVDEAALCEALRSGHLGGAGLDVFEVEPLRHDHPLLSFQNVILTPHIAAGTRDALCGKMQAVFANLQRYTRNEPLKNLVPNRPPIRLR
ncbi:MAG: 2-hydroxyacid dehydrogenase [Pirellula sp.]